MKYALTNLGIVSALGRGAAETERRLFAGDTSGMREVRGLLEDGTTRFGFALSPREDLLGGTFTESPTRAGALIDAALEQLDSAIDDLTRTVPLGRMGVVVGTSNSTMEEFTDCPDHIDMAYPALRIKARWSFGGPAWGVSTACSSSAKAFASARKLLTTGLCDVVVVGGVDACTRVVLDGFQSLESLSSKLTRPLCADREGINLGEGAAFFILRRDVEGIGLLGVGESSDAHHLTAPDPEGRGAEESMRQALADAGLLPEEIDYVNLHGTGTLYNDAMECAAVRRVFGKTIRCSSTKPLTGHCLGAAGAIEAALCWITLARGRGLPPQVALPVDSEMAGFEVPLVGDETPVSRILSNSFAFGGSNASIVLGRDF